MMKNILIGTMLLFFSMQLHAQNDTYRTPLFDLDYNRPTLKLQGEQLANKNRFLRYLLLSGYREGVEPFVGQYGVSFIAVNDTVTKTRRISFYNESLLGILSMGFNRDDSKDVVLEVADPFKYRFEGPPGERTAWLRKNGYCLEMVFPNAVYEKNPGFVEEMLRHAFPGLAFGTEKRPVDALVLVRTSKDDKLRSKGDGEGFYDRNGFFSNIPVDRLGDYMYRAGLPRLVDETGYTGNVDMDLNIHDWKDLAEVRAAIKRYDLELREEKRELEVFVIRELKKK